jgi:hypothetical protein
MAFEQTSPLTGFTTETLALRNLLRGSGQTLASMERDGVRLEARASDQSVWLLVLRPGRGGLALRAAPARAPIECSVTSSSKSTIELRIGAQEGEYEASAHFLEDALLRVTLSLTPNTNVLVPFWPRDLYPLDNNLDPTGAQGRVEAAQRGVNSGLCYFCLSKPAFGNVLYFQNLTALNQFFELTRAKPDGAVGGRWPELGYQPPTAPLGNSPPEHPIPAGQRVVISDALIALDSSCATSEQASAASFQRLLARVYRHIDKPPCIKRDWATRAQKTLASLRHPDVIVRYEGETFLHPYLAAEYPDCMTQAAVAAAIAEFEAIKGKQDRACEYVAGLDKFYDPSLKTLRRYLPDVGKDKDRREVDSWYLYHPLMNLARLANHGHDKAKRLFLDCLPYAIEAARHFEYKWPILFDVVDKTVIKAARDHEDHGQTDVGGLYAFVMLLAAGLTGDETYVEEARRAIRTAQGLRFELVYQTNLTAWGALACMKLAAIDRSDFFRAQADIYIAGFLHNVEMWESKIDNAKHYKNFLGATCLHDACYMAAFECFDSFAAFEELLRTHGDALTEDVRLLLTDYCRYALDRAWFFYPDALPPEVLSEKVRNGRVDRTLSFPLEDLYGDGRPAGQVGQEIYGCGGAFIFASRARRFSGARESGS